MSNPGEVGRLSAALTIDGAEAFQRKLAQVGQSFTETEKKGSAFGRAGEAAFRTAAGATTALTTAAAAYLTILMKTGVSYNSLQQNSRAALSVMLGGAQQANAQMDKLDAFARNSPFAKDVFVQAQQQLLGFGVEAQKVIPYLDAIQNAVAATGGSSARVGELSLIMSQIQSSAKITATDLREFGNRGVDAAELIGSQMGKTAAQIRDEITAGTLDATVALDALAAGMQAKFGGTTELVKQQWTGATDRIRAANRDLGAALAEPFVSQQGGGMAVTWANQVADVLRAIEKQAKPVMEILTVRGGGLFSGITQGLDQAQQSIDRFNPGRINEGLDRLARHAPGIAAVSGAVLALGANVGPLGAFFSMLNITINPVVAAFAALSLASPELRGALMDLVAAGKPLLPVLGEIATIASGTLSTALPVVADGVRLVVGVATPLVEILASIPAPVLLGVAAFLALHRAVTPLEGGLKSVGEAFKNADAIRAYNAGLSPTTALLAQTNAAAVGATGAVKGLGTALKTAFLSNPIGIALTVVSTAIGVWAMANAAAQQKVEEHRAAVSSLKETLNQTTGATTAATKAQIEKNIAESEGADTLKRYGISEAEAAQAILEGGAAYEELKQRIEETTAARQESENVTNSAQISSRIHAEGKAAVEILEEQIAAHQEAQQAVRDKIQADRDAAAAMTDAARSNQRFNEALEVARDITQDAETRVRALKQALDELKGGTISAEEAQARLSETNLSLAEGLTRTDEAGNKLWASLITGTGEIDKSSQAGLDFYNTMDRARSGMLDAARQASDVALANGDLAGAYEAARGAGDNYLTTLQQTMRDQGVAEEKIAALTAHYLDVPSVVATLLTDNGSISEIDQRLLQLAGQIEQTPDKTVEIDEEGNADVIAKLKDLGFAVTHLPDGKVSVSAVGIEATEVAINYLARPRTVPISFSSSGLNHSAAANRADGGIDTADGRHFANGGFASGIYAGVMGGIPKMGVDGVPHLFAEKHLGVDWETYISSRASRERNAMLLMETAQRIGFPVIPVSALRGIRAFADGGTVGGGSAAAPALGRAVRPLEINIYGHAGMSVDDIAERVREVVREEVEEML